MKNIINKSKIAALLLIMVGFTSCDAILDQEEIDFGKGPVLTSFAKPVNELNVIKTVANTPIQYEFDITYKGGKGIALDKDVTVVIATSPKSKAKEGVEFSLPVKSFTIPAGSKTAKASMTILTGGLVPFDFKDIVLEIKESSQSIAELNTFTLTVKALGAESLAGEYEVIGGDYWRLGVNNGWGALGGTRIIEAISATTYKHAGFFGLFEGFFYFTVDAANNVTVLKTNPVTGETLLQGTAPFLTCNNDSSSLTNVKCGTSNKVTRTNDRRDIIYLSYGYNTPGSGPREFYEVLKRKK
ncbi:hypothetical protein LNP27_01525 [Flavobacterium galactosidilyticum]|uniref:hypothetical protein n=1 Tax=Flavobacterium galactosidilyticum TaxID=2893886 RepID=UPI001E42F6D7|nr:hypothetical protein [Flavobacterium sp. F-340]UFH46740.1 hypothetical protein LNP27_01525 [Flavobacterium sp. F-340]